jgi:hypothetical protein
MVYERNERTFALQLQSAKLGKCCESRFRGDLDGADGLGRCQGIGRKAIARLCGLDAG